MSNNLIATATYRKEVTAQTTNSNITSVKVIEVEGPFDGGGNYVASVNKEEQYVYCVTLDKDPRTVDFKKIKWAVSYDESDEEFTFEYIKGGYLEGDRLRIWLQSGKATYSFKIHTYTGALPRNGSSVEVSIDHKQFKAYKKTGTRSNTPPNVTVSPPRMEVDKNGQSYVHVLAVLTDHQKDFILDESEIFFTVRLAIEANNGVYFPYPSKGKEYYLSFRSQTLEGGTNGVSSSSSSFEDAFVENQEAKFLPFSELISNKTW
ncbi:MAG: hypothetical protein JKY08_08020 [Flavobacteriaceae bacterium]|nr:hypothetical protein [Flavobacteriaceae bacterium]